MSLEPFNSAKPMNLPSWCVPLKGTWSLGTGERSSPSCLFIAVVNHACSLKKISHLISNLNVYGISLQPLVHAMFFTAIFKLKIPQLLEILWVFAVKVSYALESLSSLFLKK